MGLIMSLTLNQYAYTNNNPLIGIDPSGHGTIIVVVVFGVIIFLYQILLSRVLRNIIPNNYLFELVNFVIYMTIPISVYKIFDIIWKHRH